MIVVFFLLGCQKINACLVKQVPIDFEKPMVESIAGPEMFRLVLEGFEQITDMQFFPTSHDQVKTKALIAQKNGLLSLVDIQSQNSSLLLKLPVKESSEQGLLGIAIHPQWQSNGLFYLHSTPLDGLDRTEISEWHLDIQSHALTKLRVIFEVEQPYANHNGGQIQFGPDGMLYIALGDGGWRNDPERNGQNMETPLGKMLRLDLNQENWIPEDNPYIDASQPLIWASGLRNPWRFSFTPTGHLIVADVGQNAWEEVSLVEKGANLGWQEWEGNHCTQGACSETDATGRKYTMPLFEYSHDLGQSITGGYVYTQTGAFENHYIFGDFITGRIWAMDLSKGLHSHEVTTREIAQKAINISTFASNGQNLFVADFGSGQVFELQLRP